MKNMISNLDEVLSLVSHFSEFDDTSMKSIICILIDKVSETSKEPVLNIVVDICDAVLAVNGVMGPYRSGTGEDHDHNN